MRKRGSTFSLQMPPSMEIQQSAARWRSAVGTLRMYDKYDNLGKKKAGVPATYEKTEQVDLVRKKLLLDGRMLSPIDTILRLDKLRQTVLLAIVRHPVTWIVSGIYATTASLARSGYWSFEDLDRASFEGADLLVRYQPVHPLPSAPTSAGSPSMRTTQLLAPHLLHAGTRSPPSCTPHLLAKPALGHYCPLPSLHAALPIPMYPPARRPVTLPLPLLFPTGHLHDRILCRLLLQPLYVDVQRPRTGDPVHHQLHGRRPHSIQVPRCPVRSVALPQPPARDGLLRRHRDVHAWSPHWASNPRALLPCVLSSPLAHQSRLRAP